jgi:hypothetical protein
MANNLFISYDLHQPGQNYDTIIAEIKKLGGWAKVHYSLWYVNSTSSASEASTQLWKVMDANDRLIVIDATNNAASWQNLSDEVAQFIKDNWLK